MLRQVRGAKEELELGVELDELAWAVELEVEEEWDVEWDGVVDL
jgi:hypothetical protein